MVGVVVVVVVVVVGGGGGVNLNLDGGNLIFTRRLPYWQTDFLLRPAINSTLSNAYSVNRVSINSDNELSPIRRQAIILTTVWLLSTVLLKTQFSEILIKVQTFRSRKCIRKYRL